MSDAQVWELIISAMTASPFLAFVMFVWYQERRERIESQRRHLETLERISLLKQPPSTRDGIGD